MIAGNADGQVIAYDLVTQECRAFFAAHHTSVPAVSVSKATGVIMTGSGQREFEEISSSDSEDSKMHNAN